MMKGKAMTDDTIYGALDEIESLATKEHIDRATMKRISQLAGRCMAMIGSPAGQEDYAARASKVQKLVAEGTDAGEAIKRARLSPGD